MSLTEGNGLYMPVAPAYGGGGMGGFGGDGAWWLLLIVLFACGGWGGGFGGGFGGGNSDFPWLINGQQGINTNVSDGFRDAQLASQISGIQSAVTSGFGDVQTALCGGFAGVNATVNGAQTAISQQLYANQIADMERSFASQTANTQGITALQAQLASCCCDNRLATASLGSDLAREACATRTNDTQNTQAILNAVNSGIQSIKDQICSDKIDAKNERIQELQTQLNMATLRESQTAQNAFIQQGFTNEVDQLYNRLSSCPVPSTPVYGRTPIFTCNGNGCGCGNFYN